jgi:cytochrome c oxidase cbb3-type subunit 1
MAKFNSLVHQIVPIWAWILLSSIFVGTIFAAQYMGLTVLSETLLNPATTRSLHITLMLYGPIMLAVSLLPFALFDKDGLNLDDAVVPLRNYFFLWHLFLFMAVVSIIMGAQRNLAFYDFAYELNFILAASGIFYIIAIFKIIKQYEIKPLWVTVSKILLFIAPIALLILMNPSFGQVERTPTGPHGDNTLGMSFTLIPLFYLMIKLHAKEKFSQSWHPYWVIPLFAYALSVMMRVFTGDLSISQEWFFQWMTFFYAPLLIMWCKRAGITLKNNPYLVISIWAFLFVMIQGNILFIPEIKEFFHKNNLVIAHAHVAIGLGIFFMGMSVLAYFYKLPEKFIHFWLYVIGIIFVPLTIAGFAEAGLISIDTTPLLWMRLIGGVLAIFGLAYFILKEIKIPELKFINLYHLNGFASDGLGAIVLILFGPILFGFLGFSFNPLYYLVFGFMGFVGILHLIGIYKEAHFLAYVTSIARFITGTMFLSLFYIGTIDGLGILVGLYDISYALIYMLFRNRF